MSGIDRRLKTMEDRLQHRGRLSADGLARRLGKLEVSDPEVIKAGEEAAAAFKAAMDAVEETEALPGSQCAQGEADIGDIGG